LDFDLDLNVHIVFNYKTDFNFSPGIDLTQTKGLTLAWENTNAFGESLVIPSELVMTILPKVEAYKCKTLSKFVHANFTDNMICTQGDLTKNKCHVKVKEKYSKMINCLKIQNNIIVLEFEWRSSFDQNKLKPLPNPR